MPGEESLEMRGEARGPSGSPSSRPLIEERALADVGKLVDVYKCETPSSLDETSTSTSSSIECSSVERRRDHEFIPTRLQPISASRPAQNPQQFTRLQSNPLLASAQQQMMRVEEVRRLKQMAKTATTTATTDEHQPEWLSELSSWKHRRRKQSEEALMRVAEMKVLEDAEKTGRRSNANLTKKLSSLLIMDEADNWSDLGLERTIPSKDTLKSGHQIRVREIPDDVPYMDKDEDDEEEENDFSNSVKNNNDDDKKDERKEGAQVVRDEEERMLDDAFSSEFKSEVDEGRAELSETHEAEFSKETSNENSGSESKQTLFDRWSSLTSMSNTVSQSSSVEKPRRRSNEIASGLRSKLEAFQRDSSDTSGSRRTSEPTNTLSVDGNAFREKLKNFQRISSQSELQQEQQERAKPPPPLKYSQLIGSCNNQEGDKSEEVFPEEVSKDLEEALEESYRSVLEEEERLKERKQVFDQVNALKNSHRSRSKTNLDDLDQSEVVLQKQQVSPGIRANTSSVEQANVGYSSTTKREHHQLLQQEQLRQEQLRQEQLRREQERQEQERQEQVRQEQVRQEQVQEAQLLQEQLLQERLEHEQQRHQQEEHLTSQRPHQQSAQRSYDQHWLVQEAEHRRLSEQTPSQLSSQPIYENNNGPLMNSTNSHIYGNTAFNAPELPKRHNMMRDNENNRPVYRSENLYANIGHNDSQQTRLSRSRDADARIPGPQTSSTSKTSESERMLSVSGRKKCSHCKEELGRGAAMIIESLRLFYHLRCFQCSVCQAQLGNGSAGTDVRVRNNKLHCHNCYSNDDGLKFSKV